jgi:riboflavin kinase/FMN adenylyltransferase
VRPTVAGAEARPSVEVHLFDTDRDLYGARLRVHLVARLRPEQRFSGLDALKAQIARDAADARALLAAAAPDPSAGGAWR